MSSSRLRWLVLSLLLGFLFLEVQGSLAKSKKVNAKSGQRFIHWNTGVGQQVDMHIAELDPANKTVRRLTEPFPVEREIGLCGHALVVSPDGKSAAYLADGTAPPEGGLVTFKAFMRSLHEAKGEGQNLGVEAHSVIAWSPDGKKLLVGTYEDRDKFTHRVVDVKAKKSTVLQLPKFEGPSGAESVRGYLVTDWSPDGKRFLAVCGYTKESGEARAFLNVINSDGSEVRRLNHIDFARGGKFSPDGSKILYMGRHEEGGKKYDQLFVADVAGGRSVRVSQELNGRIQFSLGGYCWSPDSKRVAYVWENGKSAEDAETFLVTVGADGKHVEVAMSARSPLPQFRGLNWR